MLKIGKIAVGPTGEKILEHMAPSQKYPLAVLMAVTGLTYDQTQKSTKRLVEQGLVIATMAPKGATGLRFKISARAYKSICKNLDAEIKAENKIDAEFTEEDVSAAETPAIDALPSIEEPAPIAAEAAPVIAEPFDHYTLSKVG